MNGIIEIENAEFSYNGREKKFSRTLIFRWVKGRFYAFWDPMVLEKPL